MRHPECWGHRPAVMGVINLTPDSFSDGGRFNRADLALSEASRQLRNGAQVLDLGAQSTRPGAHEVGTKEELARLIPCLKSIRAVHPQVIISVDTFLAPVAGAALEAGADWINDVSGGRRDPAMLPFPRRLQAPSRARRRHFSARLGRGATTGQPLIMPREFGRRQCH